jgi:hypothetical protein
MIPSITPMCLHTHWLGTPLQGSVVTHNMDFTLASFFFLVLFFQLLVLPLICAVALFMGFCGLATRLKRQTDILLQDHGHSLCARTCIKPLRNRQGRHTG